jgi:hypothetical protein
MPSKACSYVLHTALCEGPSNKECFQLQLTFGDCDQHEEICAANRDVDRFIRRVLWRLDPSDRS